MSSDSKSTPVATRIVDPTVRFIAQLLEDLRSGQLFIPRFQRGDVWDDDDRLELLNSIETLIPIGSIMLWRTQLELRTRIRIGGHQLPTPPQQPPNTPRDYVLDGLQRLSTLLRALAPAESGTARPEASDEDDQPSRPIYYDLREETFRVSVNERNELWHLPTTVLLHTVPLLAFQRRLSEANLLDRDELIQRADRLANSFRTYKIPVVWLVTNRLEDATQAFHRINSKGVTMSEVHMLNALTYSSSFDLEQTLEELKPRLAEVGWSALEPKYLLATVRALCGLDVTQPNAEILQSELKKNPARIEQAVNALVQAAYLLHRKCGIPTPFWLPYAYQAVFLAYALREPLNPENLPEREQSLADWLWRTSYTDYLRSGSRYQMQIATMEALNRISTGEIAEWRATDGMRVEAVPAKMNFRTARTKLLGLRLAMLKPCALADGQAFDAASILALHENEAFGFILARSAAGPERFNSPENRILYPPERWESDRLLLDFLNGPEETVLRSHLLDAKCIEYFREHKYKEFLDRRRTLIQDYEGNYLRNLSLEPIR